MRYVGMLICCALLTLAACNPVKKTSTEVPGTNGTVKVKTTDNGGGGAAIKLGFNLEETGTEATFGQSSHKGAQMAIDELNAAGGIDGRKVEAVFDDNNSDSAQAATVASKLVNQDKVDVLIGCVASSNSIAMAKITDEGGVPMVSPASTRVDLTLNKDKTVRKFIFRTCFTDDFQGEAMADFVVNGEIHGTKAVLLYDKDSDYSIGIADTIKAVAASKHLEIVAEDSYLGKSETDFRSHLSRFKGMQFDALIVPGYYGQVSQIANQAREIGLTQPLVGGDGWDSPDLWKVAGKNIEGSYFTNHYSPEDQDQHVQDFIQKYKQTYGGEAGDAMAILAYDSVMVVADAIRRAGGTDKEAVAAALAETKDYQAASGKITINDKHNALKKLVVLKVGEGGKQSWVFTYEPGNASSGTAEASDATPAQT